MTTKMNPSLPPPINWATKPKRRPANIINHSLDHVEELGTPPRRLVPVFINLDHIADLQEALQHLTSESPHRHPKLELQVDTIIDDERNIETLFIINSQQSQEDHIHVEDVGSPFSHLSMSPNCRNVTRTHPVTPKSTTSAQSPLGMRTATLFAISGMSPQTSKKKMKILHHSCWKMCQYIL